MAESRESESVYILGAGLLFYIIAGFVLVFSPWLEQAERQQHIVTIDGKTVATREPTEAERHGRAIYIRENCVICHSQVVRGGWEKVGDGSSVELVGKGGDVERYGPISQPGESGRDMPHLYGTRRIGPDLAREGAKFADAWHVSHFYDPQAVSPGSVMPKFTWLYLVEYEGATGEPASFEPTVELMDLISYVQSLGVGIGDWRGGEAADEFDEEEFKATFEDKNAVAKLAKKGREVYLRFNCVSCHGDRGHGDGPAGAAYPDANQPRDYHDPESFKWGWDPVSIRTTIQKGRPDYMPSHPQLNNEQLAALAAYVIGLAEE